MRRPSYMAVGSLVLAACGTLAPAPAPRAEPAQSTADASTAPAPIPREELQSRRAALAARMDDGLLIVFGANEPAADYLPFAQDVSFRYLTGIDEPGATLLIQKDDGEVNETLFVLPRDPAREVWEGARLGTEGATRQTGIPARSAPPCRRWKRG